MAREKRTVVVAAGLLGLLACHDDRPARPRDPASAGMAEAGMPAVIDAGTACGPPSDPHAIAGSFRERRLDRELPSYEVRSPVVRALPDGRVVMAYYLGGASVMEPGLYVSRQRADGNFDEELVAAGTERDGHDLAVDGTRLVASYFVADELQVAVEGEDGWTLYGAGPLFDPQAARSALAIDADGHVHAAYVDGRELRYAHNRGRLWGVEPVTAAESVAQLGIAVDRNGVPHFTYQLAGVGGEGVRYVEGPAPFRRTELTLEAVDAHALLLDADDRPHVAMLMRKTPSKVVHHAGNGDRGWSLETIEPPADGMSDLHRTGLDIAVEGNGDLHMAALSSHGPVYFAQRDERWISGRIPAPGPTGAPSLSVDADGAVHIVATSFRYPNDTAIHYYTNRGTTEDASATRCER